MEQVKPLDTEFLSWALGDTSNLTPQQAQKLSILRREDVVKPTFYVGTGTCGLGAGAGETLEAVKTFVKENNLDADIVEVGCVGLCAVEPIVDVQLPGKNRIAFQQMTKDVTPAVLDAIVNKGEIVADHVMGQYRDEKTAAWDGVVFIDEHPFFAPQTRWVLANCGLMDPGSLEEYIARGGYRALKKTLANKVSPDDICKEVLESGLRGRGGGGFPAGRKWMFARANEETHRYLICNADEGDPGAFMDRAVIEGDPHRLLEGMALAAYAIGAQKAYIYIRAEYPLAIARLRVAIAEAKANNLLGDNILGSDFSLEMVIKMGAGAFVCGEETALIHSIEGKRGMPRPRPPFPAVSGLFGYPTIINNVETLANVASIVDKGAKWFNAIGTEGSKGTKVFALSGKVNRTGLVEVAMGTTIRDVIFSIGGGIANGKAYKAVQIGGPSGGCIPESHIDIEIDYESLKTVGAIMGSGGLVVMDEDNCMVDVAKFFMDFIQRESCGKCTPCREGTRRMLEILNRITRSDRNESEQDTLERFQSVVHMEKLGQIIQDTSLCALGQTAPNPVLSTIRWFRDEYEAHIFDRKCPAKVCSELLKFEIIADKCKGCTLCAKNCPVGAITGTVKQPHVIDPEKCISCGLCMSNCRFDAILKK